MYNICVFGGTTEGRELVEFLSAQPCNVTACVVTDYAQSLLPASGHVTVSAKKLPAGEIAAMLLSQRFDLVVDATHPYAQSITKSIARGKGYTLDESCCMPLTAYYDRKQAEDAASNGNGRMARNTLEKAILNQSKRLIADPGAPLELLLPGDFELEE